MKTNKTLFSAMVKLPKIYDQDEVIVDVELDKDEEHLTYDEVEDAIYKKVDELYHCMQDFDDDNANDDLYEDDDQWPSIISIVINADDGESYPVISDTMDDSELKSSKAFSKYLVLPNAVYSLTPEAKLWMYLKENGIIDEDAPFDYEQYHKIIKSKKFMN